MTFSKTAASLFVAVALIGQLPGANALEPYFSTAEGALQGYDPVAYFAQQQAVKGDPRWRHVWQGAEWHFASAANRDAFIADPERYAPQFGGYCAYGVSQGYAPRTDPTAFTVVDGKLYLNYNRTVSQKWNATRETLIERGQQNWPRLKEAAPAQ